jgi:2'-5' RNA ligase
MRLFIGIPLSEAVLSELAAVVAPVRRKDDGLRWMPPESWHITLQFLGNTDPEQYQCLLAHLADVRSPPVPVLLDELGFFQRTGVFFAGVRISPELELLVNRVVAATAPCGFIAESRAFHPHITLARAKGQNRDQPLHALETRIQRQPAFTRFVASKFLLYESHLSPTGSTYEVLRRFPLA